MVTKFYFLNQGLSIPQVQTQVDSDGKLTGDRAESITKNMDAMLTELDFVGTALLSNKAQ